MLFQAMLRIDINHTSTFSIRCGRIESIMLDLGLDVRRCFGSEAIELIMAAAFGGLFGVELHHVIDQDSEFARVPAKLQAEPRIFEAHIKRHLLDNLHRLFCVGRPGAGIQDAWQAGVEADLARMRDAVLG
jgi:hypothetical protein